MPNHILAFEVYMYMHMEFISQDSERNRNFSTPIWLKGWKKSLQNTVYRVKGHFML